MKKMVIFPQRTVKLPEGKKTIYLWKKDKNHEISWDLTHTNGILI